MKRVEPLLIENILRVSTNILNVDCHLLKSVIMMMMMMMMMIMLLRLLLLLLLLLLLILLLELIK